MGLLDDLKKLMDDTGEQVEDATQRAAAAGALQAARAAAEALGSDFLDTAEAELDAARAQREGRTDYSPRKTDTPTTIAEQIHAAAQQAEDRQRALRHGHDDNNATTAADAAPSTQPQALDRTPTAREDRRARALRELKRLKAQAAVPADQPGPDPAD